MHKKLIVFLSAALLSLGAGEWKDIPYYSKDAPKQGNIEYRNERCKLDLKTPALQADGEFAVLQSGYPLIYQRGNGEDKYLILIQPARRSWQTQLALPGTAGLSPLLPTEISATVNEGVAEFSGSGTQFGIWKING